MTNGLHRGSLLANDSVNIAFTFEWKASEKDSLLIIHNAEERIEVKEMHWENDSLTLQMPVFVSYFRMINTPEGMLGYWYNPDKAPGYKVAAVFERGVEDRYPKNEAPSFSLYNRWRVMMYAGTDRESAALGEFHQEGNKVTGSILTETGDYRYLEGCLAGDQLQMSTFDGAHAYAFVARVASPGEMAGTFYSGHHFLTAWTAVRDDDFQLTDALQISQWKDPASAAVTLNFPEVNGDQLQPAPASLVEGKKLTIVQISGSWCPNCMDETRYFLELKERLQTEELGLVAVQFERFGEWERDQPAVLRMKRDLQMDYPILYGGSVKHVQDSLPLLQPFRSFPTSLFLDEDGKVIRVHTGFSGPGTSAFAAYAEETEAFVRQQLSR